jgi:hypothetical protein
LLADAADGDDDDALVASLIGGWKKCRFLAEDDGGGLVLDMVKAQPTRQTNWQYLACHRSER